MRKIKNLARIVLAFSIAIMLANCEKDNIDVNSQDASVANAKNWFEKSSPELTILKETKQIDWDHAIVTDGAKGKVVEVPIVLKDNLAVKGDDKSLITHNRLMFIVDEKRMYKLSHVLITTKESKFATSDKDFNFYKIKNDFEGYITVLNAKNKVSYINAITKKASSITSKMKIEDEVCLAMCKMYDDGSYDVLYLISCGKGGGSSGGSDGSGGYGGNGDGSVASEWQLQANINQSDPAAFNFGFMELLQQQKNQVLAKTSFYLMPWCGIDAFVVQNKNIGKPFSIDSVTTDTWGLSTGYSWNQNAFTQSTTGNRTTLTIIGTLTYNTFIEGIGDLFTRTVTYEIIINNTNGHIESGTRL